MDRRTLIMALVADATVAELGYMLAQLPVPGGRQLEIMCPDGASQTLTMRNPADTVRAVKDLLVERIPGRMKPGQMKLFEQGQEDELEDDRLVIALTSLNLFLLVTAGCRPCCSCCPEIPQWKLVLVGDGGVGKSTFAKRHVGDADGDFEKKYVSTLPYEIEPVRFHTNRGEVHFNIFHWAGYRGGDAYHRMRNGFLAAADCAIIMFDVGSRLSYQSVPNWHRHVSFQSGDIPIVLCGNKADAAERKVKPKQITFHRKKCMQYFDVSAETGHQAELPFLSLAQQLAGDEGLRFVDDRERSERLLPVSFIAPPAPAPAASRGQGAPDDDDDDDDDDL